MSKKTKAPAETSAKHPDAPLIKACMEYAIALHGASGAFAADPTADADFAQIIDTGMLRRAEKAQASIVGYLPSTFDGLRSKAEAAKAGLDYDRQNVTGILKSLAEDVARFHKTLNQTKAFATTAEIAP